MSDKTVSGAQLVLNAFLRNVPLNVTTAFLALKTSSSAEVEGGSYARQPISFAAPVAKAAASSADVEFAGMPAVSVSHGSICTGLTGPNEVYVGAFAVTRTFQAGDIARAPAGSVTVTEN